MSPATLGLLIVLAVVLWGASLLIDSHPPFARAGTLEYWGFFARQVVRDVARALALVCMALAVSGVAPGIGLFLQRVVFGSSRWAFLLTTVCIAVVGSILFSSVVLGGMAHIQDEIAMHFQAKVLASGRLYAPSPPLPDFFDYEFIVIDGPRWYGKYFLGASLLMVPGVWFGVPWIISPLLGGLAVVLVYALGRGLFNEKVARIAAVLMMISPFRVSLFGMMMAHPACLVAMALFALAVVYVVRDPSRWGWAAVAGAAGGFAFNCRPLTAVAMGAVIGGAAALRLPWSRLRWQTVAAFLGTSAVFALVFLGYNRALTGDPFTSPFTKWCPSDHLGFGPDVGLDYMPPEDLGHTWQKALFRNSYFSLDALGTNLTGWGHVTLLLLLWAVLRSPWPRRTRAAGAVVGSLVIAYGFYYTPSVFAGQARYWSEAMPMMLLLVAVALVNLRRGMPGVCRVLALPRPVRTGAATCWVAGLLLTLWSIPGAYLPLYDECGHNYWGQSPMLRDLAERSGVEDAVVFMKADHYREHARKRKWDVYGSGFDMNDPDLKNPLIYARDLGPARNAELMALYPGRSAYWVDVDLQRDAGLVPLVLPATRPAQ